MFVTVEAIGPSKLVAKGAEYGNHGSAASVSSSMNFMVDGSLSGDFVKPRDVSIAAANKSVRDVKVGRPAPR